jgi:hypothetical protein
MSGTGVKYSPEAQDSQSFDSVLLGEQELRVAREYQVARVRLRRPSAVPGLGGSCWFLASTSSRTQTNVTAWLGITFMSQHH